MYNLLLGLLVLDGIFLGVVILLQAGKGGGLAAMGGGAAATDVLGGRQATTLLTRATWTAGSVFMAVSLILAIMSSRVVTPTSVLEGLTEPVPTVPQPILPGMEPAADDESTDAPAEEAPPVPDEADDGSSGEQPPPGF